MEKALTSAKKKCLLYSPNLAVQSSTVLSQKLKKLSLIPRGEGCENPKYVLLIEFILLISWHVNPFFPAAESSLWLLLFFWTQLAKHSSGWIDLFSWTNYSRAGLFLLRVFFFFESPQNSLPSWCSQKRHKSLPVISLACLCLKKDKWDLTLLNPLHFQHLSQWHDWIACFSQPLS